LRHYRLYRLDGAGKISAAEWIDAACDEEALEQAHAQAGKLAFELWERDRIIGRSPEPVGREAPF